MGKSKQILQVVDMLEKTHRWKAIVLLTDKLEDLWTTFKSLFKTIKAAGGLVENELEEVLWIFRRASWDLPKGKIDAGEKKKEAALREVEEETGITGLELGTKLPTTYHTYRTAKGKRILKKTYWYIMKAPKQTLIPQTEEDIELAVWKKSEEFKPEEETVYGNILDVYKAYLIDN